MSMFTMRDYMELPFTGIYSFLFYKDHNVYRVKGYFATKIKCKVHMCNFSLKNVLNGVGSNARDFYKYL